MRVILERYNTRAEEPIEGNKDEWLVVGWDFPLATYFWQIMGTGDEKGIAIRYCGYHPNELPTWAAFMSSLPREFTNVFSERSLRDVMEAAQREHGRETIDLTEWPGWKAEFSDGSGFASNGLTFPAREHAVGYAEDLFRRWTGSREWRVVRSPDAPTHEWNPGAQRAGIIV